MKANQMLKTFKLVLLAIIVGCGGAKPSQQTALPVAASSASQEELPVVKRIEYQNWSQFPVGTAVTRVRQIGEGTDQVVQTTRYKLAENNDQQVVIEPDVMIQSNGRQEANPMGTIEYRATFRLPAGMTEAMFAMPDPKAESQGTEQVEVLGKTYNADVFTWKTSSEAGPVSNKVWMSQEIPGRIIKHQTEVVGRKTEEMLTRMDIPAK